MNGKHKFHKPNGPAFNAGEVWVSASGGIKATIISVRKFGEGKHDYMIKYHFSDGMISEKESYSFQVRYKHPADSVI